jgi:hypothetical protein
MKTEKQIQDEVRLWALESLLCQVSAVFMTMLPPGGAELAFSGLLAAAKKNSFPDLDPALSDHYAAELEIAVKRLVKLQKAYMADARKKSG